MRKPEILTLRQLGAVTWTVGEHAPCRNSIIGEIRDCSLEWPDKTHVQFDIFDTDGNIIARLINPSNITALYNFPEKEA